MSTNSLERLDVWRKAHEYALRIHQVVIPQLPAEEKWGLAQQLRRSTQSIPANIAEGYGRYYYQDNIRFCYIARGSLTESLSQLHFIKDAEYLPDNTIIPLLEAGQDLARLINGYIGYLKRTRQGANEPGASNVLKEMDESYQHQDTPENLDETSHA